jgi:hypothetical protein
LSGQLESPHFFRRGDSVRNIDGREGTISEAWALFAEIMWDNGIREEVEQFDSRVVVMQRAGQT